MKYAFTDDGVELVRGCEAPFDGRVLVGLEVGQDLVQVPRAQRNRRHRRPCVRPCLGDRRPRRRALGGLNARCLLAASCLGNRRTRGPKPHVDTLFGSRLDPPLGCIGFLACRFGHVAAGVAGTGVATAVLHLVIAAKQAAVGGADYGKVLEKGGACGDHLGER
jgi:hypothetical protein